MRPVLTWIFFVGTVVDVVYFDSGFIVDDRLKSVKSARLKPLRYGEELHRGLTGVYLLVRKSSRPQGRDKTGDRGKLPTTENPNRDHHYTDYRPCFAAIHSEQRHFRPIDSKIIVFSRCCTGYINNFGKGTIVELATSLP